MPWRAPGGPWVDGLQQMGSSPGQSRPGSAAAGSGHTEEHERHGPVMAARPRAATGAFGTEKGLARSYRTHGSRTGVSALLGRVVVQAQGPEEQSAGSSMGCDRHGGLSRPSPPRRSASLRSIAEDKAPLPRATSAGGQAPTVTSVHHQAESKQICGTARYLDAVTKPRGCAASPPNGSICLIMLAARKLHFVSRLNLSNLNFQA